MTGKCRGDVGREAAGEELLLVPSCGPKAAYT